MTTFVLQGGEDGYFTEERIIHIVRRIREHFPQCAITLSIGEWKKHSYQAFFDAGADRYLLRHETYNPEHYAKLHPPILSAAHRQHLHLQGFQAHGLSGEWFQARS